MDKIYTAKELGELLGVGRTTIWRYQKEGLLKPIRVKRKVYYAEKDIEQLINDSRE